MAENQKPLKQEEFGESTAARGKKGIGRGTQKGRRVAPNVFDLIVILLLAVVITLLVIGVRSGALFGREEGTEVTLTYTVLMTDVPEAYARYINVGDTVYDVDSGVVLGRVSAIPRVSSYTVPGLVESGSEGGEVTTEMKAVPGRINLSVTIACDANYYAGEGYQTEGRTVRIGDVYTLRFPNYVGAAVCSALTATSATK